MLYVSRNMIIDHETLTSSNVLLIEGPGKRIKEITKVSIIING
jgi:hypothetical protein